MLLSTLPSAGELSSVEASVIGQCPFCLEFFHPCGPPLEFSFSPPSCGLSLQHPRCVSTFLCTYSSLIVSEARTCKFTYARILPLPNLCLETQSGSPTADGQVMFFVTMEQDGLQGLFQSLATSPLRNSDCPTNYEDVDTDVVGTSRDWANRLQTTGLHTKYMQFLC